MQKNYLVTPTSSNYVKFGDGVFTASSPKSAVSAWLKENKLTGKPVKCDSAFNEVLLNQGYDNLQVIQMIDFIVELIGSSNPVSGTTNWHINF